MNLASGTKARDPAETKARILKASKSEFAENGFAGARVDKIAVRANVSKQSIYMYFGDKESLFSIVLDYAFDELRHALPWSEKAIPELAVTWFDYFNKDVELLRLFLWERLEGHNPGRHDVIVNQVKSIEEEQQAGRITTVYGAPEILMFLGALSLARPLAPEPLQAMAPVDENTMELRRQAISEAAARLLKP